jgi:GMP synthase-like glutamine amidotransferase
VAPPAPPYNVPSGSPPEPRPDGKDLVWILWYDNEDTHRAEHDIARDGVVRDLEAVFSGMSTSKIWVYETADTAARLDPPPPVVDFANFDSHPDRQRLLALVLLGSFPWWESYTPEQNAGLAPIKLVLRTTEVPILAFCGGHQLVAKAFATGPVDPVGHIFQSDNERDGGQPFTREENYEEEDGKPVVVTLNDDGRADPIYAYLAPKGAGYNPSFMFWHHDEVKILHPDFKLLASTALSVNQSLVHRQKLIYTTQFHPEQSGSPLDGDGLVQTFFRFAARFWIARAG